MAFNECGAWQEDLIDEHHGVGVAVNQHGRPRGAGEVWKHDG